MTYSYPFFFCCLFSLFLLLPNTALPQSNDITKVLISEATVEVPIEKAWWGWTTNKGVQSFFAANSDIDFRVGGNYNVSLYNKENSPNKQNTILSFTPFQAFSFEYAIPEKFPSIQGEKTKVTVEFLYRTADQTDVTLTQLGWGQDGEWDAAYDYFQQTWLLALVDMQTYLPQIKPSDTYAKEIPDATEMANASANKKAPSASSKPSISKPSTVEKPSKYSFNPAVTGKSKETPTQENIPIKEEIKKDQTMDKPTEKQQFAYILTLTDPELIRNPEAWTKEQSALVGVHFNYLKKLTAEGVVIMAGRSPHPELGFGIVVFEAESRAAAQEIMNSDPAVKNGLMKAEFHDFRVALMRE
ncbi:MAG: YciI family protein [Chitinophagales bacterium]